MLSDVYLLPSNAPDGLPTTCSDKCGYAREEGVEYYCFVQGGWQTTNCSESNFRVKRSGNAIHKAPTTSTNKYCDISINHTMCKYDGPSTECALKTERRLFSESGKILILEKHNELRRKVAQGQQRDPKPQPSASNMRKMVWNEELAATAQRWADQCNFSHDRNRRKLDKTYVGQNAYLGMNSQNENLTTIMSKMDEPVQAWYDEVVNNAFDPVDINPFKFDYTTGHYTAVVWAESEELGCGQVVYKEGDWFKNIVVCNYAMGGNIVGSAMYEEGEPCSNCPSGYQCNNSLCAQL